MALPAKKRTKSSKKKRASHFALKKVQYHFCPNCGRAKLFHRACPQCGTYHLVPKKEKK